MLQRIALYATLGMVLDAVELSITHWAFWSILGLFIASEWMTRRETMERVEEYIRAVRAQVQRVTDAAQEVKAAIEEHKDTHK